MAQDSRVIFVFLCELCDLCGQSSPIDVARQNEINTQRSQSSQRTSSKFLIHGSPVSNHHYKAARNQKEESGAGVKGFLRQFSF
jgi:hypothetical protein